MTIAELYASMRRYKLYNLSDKLMDWMEIHDYGWKTQIKDEPLERLPGKWLKRIKHEHNISEIKKLYNNGKEVQ